MGLFSNKDNVFIIDAEKMEEHQKTLMDFNN